MKTESFEKESGLHEKMVNGERKKKREKTPGEGNIAVKPPRSNTKKPEGSRLVAIGKITKTSKKICQEKKSRVRISQSDCQDEHIENQAAQMHFKSWEIPAPPDFHFPMIYLA